MEYCYGHIFHLKGENTKQGIKSFEMKKTIISRKKATILLLATLIYLSCNIAFAGTALAATWQSDTAIASGLGDVGGYSSPAAFQKDGIWYLISGGGNGVFFGYNWTGATWQSDTAISGGLGDVGTHSKPTVFQKDSIWYLISGEHDGVFFGYNWTGSTWQADTTISSGLGDVGVYSSPVVFLNDSIWYLISGEDIGVFTGYNWTGTTWQADTAISSGLGDVGGYSSPAAFQKDGIWYLISGEHDGVFFGYNWTGSTWQADTTIASGLGDVGTRSKSAVFQKDGIWYLISGEYDGGFNGYIPGCNYSLNNYTLTVKARDITTGSDINHFIAELSTGEVRETVYGETTFTCLESGYYEVTVSASQYEHRQETVILDQNKTVIVYLLKLSEPEYFLPTKHLVEFQVVSIWGVPLSNVNVTALGYETTMTNLTWLDKWFGYSPEVEIYNSTMTGLTDSNGALSFMMVETIKYKMWFTNTSQNISAYREIYPKDERYVITIGEIPTQKIAYWITTAQNNTANTANITLHYSDYNSPVKTNWVNFSIYYLDNDTLAYTYNITSISETNENTSINLNASYSYKVKCVADHDDFGVFEWYVTVVFIMPEKPKLPVVQTLKNSLEDWQLQTFSLFVIILFALIFGAYSSGVGGMAVSFMAIGFHLFGMMPLVPTLAGAVIYPLIIVMAILNLLSEQKGSVEA